MAAFPPISRAGFQTTESFNLFHSLLQSDLEDKELRLLGWNDLKLKAPIGPLNIPKMMQEIEQESLNNGKPLVDNVNELFERFAAKLAPEFETAQVPAAARQVTELQVSALQERLREHYENNALETIWNACLLSQFQAQGAFAQEALPSGHQAIREWLNNPVNQPRIQQITQFGPVGLSLIGLGLKVLPPEIGLFTGLTALSLSGNQLSYLPDSFGNLQALEELNLSDNQLSFLPDSFGNLQALKFLDLSENQLSFLPDSFGSLKVLHELYLYQNRLSFLPDSFGSLQALNNLFLESNQLRNLPDSFSNLQALSHLFLNDNQLCLLPEFFGKIWDSCSIALHDNPLMLALDPDFGKLGFTGSILASYLEEVREYIPQSPLAAIFKAIAFQQPVEKIQEAYAHLSQDMQQQIANLAAQKLTGSAVAEPMAASSSSDPSPGQDNLFTDIDLLARSVRKAVIDRFESLTPDQTNGVYNHVWDLAGRPETDDSNWGEHHVFDHALRFTDALERATIN
ncbi:MAG: leucine-rich repeat domain-containing protein [Verrucomicrobia bacterium]|nr:leucine-rich repeat domain-containing protein [Verrucomicrobiota bacterium]